MDERVDETGGRSDAPAEQHEFLLVEERPSMGPPVMLGVLTGLAMGQLLDGAGYDRTLSALAGLVVSLLTATLLSAQARRQVADRLRITARDVALTRDGRVIRAVRLDRLDEVNEIETPGGKVLILSDDRRTLGIGAFQLAREREYPEIAAHVVEAMQRLDPTGERARAAVEAGRTREKIAQQPVRGTLYLALAIFAAAILAERAAGSLLLAGKPFPLDLAGGLVVPLVEAGEYWRLLGHAFLSNGLAHGGICAVAVLSMGTWLERLLGWERVLLGFGLGVAAAGLSLVVVGWPVPFLGADGGVFGLLGMVFAVLIVGRRRLPRWFRPGPLFWIITIFAAMQLPGTQRSFGISPAALLVFPQLPQQIAEAAGLAWILPHLAALLVGVAAGALMVSGGELPATRADRLAWRPFAWLTVLAFAIGLAGIGLHPTRRHRDDARILADAIDTMPATPYAAQIQNRYAYEMLIDPRANDESIELGATLADTAVRNSQRLDPTILDTLAVARFRQNRLDDARALLAEAKQATEKLAVDERFRATLRKLLDERLREVDAGGPLTEDPSGTTPTPRRVRRQR